MDRKRKYWLIFGLIICVSTNSFTYWQMKNSQNKLNDYWLAIDCPISTNCREKKQAKIIRGNSVILNLPGGKGISLNDTHYNVYISSEIFDSRRVKILGNPLTNGTPFDIPNVITIGSDADFATYNLYPYRKIYIESWRNQITLIFFDMIFKSIEIEEQLNTPEITSTIPIKNYDIAIPTSNHPIILSSKAESNFYGYAVISGAIFLFCISGLIFVRKDNREKIRD